MIIQGQVGIPTTKQTAGNPNIVQGSLAEILTSELVPAYYNLLKNNNVFYAGASGSTIAAAYVGAGGGYPLLAIYNPLSSGVDVVILQTRIGIRTMGTTAASNDFNWWGTTVTTAPSANMTRGFSMYSQQQTGSAVQTFIQAAAGTTAMTSQAPALTMLAPVMSLGATPGTTAVQNVFQALDLTQGTIICAPGNIIALGSAAVMTTASSVDASMIWAEIPA